jgi:LPP20 lipoprotein
MPKITNVLLMSVVALDIAACSTPPAKVEKVAECVFPSSDQAAPLWVCDAPVEGMAVGAVGSAARSDAGIAIMKQIAATEARVRLAQNMKVQVQNMIKQYAEKNGAGSKETVDRVNASVAQQITNQTLQGAKILRSIVAPDGTMLVLAGMDEAAAQKLIETAIKTSMSNDQSAWQQFKAQKGQDELAVEIAKQKVATPAQ